MPSATAPKTKTDGREVKRLNRQQRYKLPAQAVPDEDLTPDFMNIVGMVFSLCGIMLKFKGCAWMALYCSCASFANYGVHDNAKQIFTSFMLSISALVMSYLQNPQPMSPIWAASFS